LTGVARTAVFATLPSSSPVSTFVLLFLRLMALALAVALLLSVPGVDADDAVVLRSWECPFARSTSPPSVGCSDSFAVAPAAVSVLVVVEAVGDCAWGCRFALF
jgi:hypothetical protein